MVSAWVSGAGFVCIGPGTGRTGIGGDSRTVCGCENIVPERPRLLEPYISLFEGRVGSRNTLEAKDYFTRL